MTKLLSFDCRNERKVVNMKQTGGAGYGFTIRGGMHLCTYVRCDFSVYSYA